jgi:UDP-N-acetylmuramate: L-alanyl-gamma-D-glutamyl-meso-diaminopimelate ligase
MRLHLLGICGTFMGGIARLAREAGHDVSGSDTNIYPPMSTQLAALDVTLKDGYRAEHLEPAPDLIVVGNAMTRGNPEVEAMLDRRLPFVSGPQWLAENILYRRRVIAVAGTHGKTTTTAMVAWILESAGMQPGFLVGGVPGNFEITARLGTGEWFIVEADEYDTAFFDKRSKFVHYRPTVLVMNNLEFDHADIFGDIADIERQFHHVVRTVPGNGLLVANGDDDHVGKVLKMGCWTPVQYFGNAAANNAPLWSGQPVAADFSRFEVLRDGRIQGTVSWGLMGRYNMENALAAVAAAVAAGVTPGVACKALAGFRPPKRRLELLGEIGGIRVYDDFAHHPTAIRETIAALRTRIGRERLTAVLEPRSNSMRLGVHAKALPEALSRADRALLYRPNGLSWNLSVPEGGTIRVFDNVADIVNSLAAESLPGDHILIMSNGSFDGLSRRLLERLRAAF